MPVALRARIFSLAVLVAASVPHAAAAAGYDPLRLPATPRLETIDRVVHDAVRQRDILLRIYLPATHTAAPVILFSHGLGGSREGSPYLGQHWAARGYVVVYLQHPGSDVAVWQDLPPQQRMAALREAASVQNFMLRVQDVSIVLDQLAAWNTGSGDALAQRLDLRHTGMSGHSFGAITTQAIGGQRYRQGQRSLADARISAALAMSPGIPRTDRGEDAFGQVSLPWLLMTGTRDASPIGDQTPESRLGVFDALPRGDKYQLVLGRAEHSAFGDRPLPGDREPRNPNHHRVILALGTAFWDANLRGDKTARKWLESANPGGLLEAGDRWQWK
jgi:dienelactone hydrolase